MEASGGGLKATTFFNEKGEMSVVSFEELTYYNYHNTHFICAKCGKSVGVAIVEGVQDVWGGATSYCSQHVPTLSISLIRKYLTTGIPVLDHRKAMLYLLSEFTKQSAQDFHYYGKVPYGLSET